MKKEAASSTRAAPAPERRSMNDPAKSVYTNDPPYLLAAVRGLYTRLPETYYREPWELQHILWSLRCTEELAPEAEIASAVEVARQDWPQWRPAA
jgi:hypothetical protein